MKMDRIALQTTPWWARRRHAALLVGMMLLPFLAVPIIPLFDLPGHMGRYAVEADFGASPFLSRWWTVSWAPLGNLGVDLLVVPLARMIGVEAATHLVVGIIPALTAAGFLWVARERHGRIMPATAFALPLAMGYPFAFGFVNFALSMALCFLAAGLWLRLGRLGRHRLRAGLFLGIGPVLWFAHVFGWAVLCILCGAIETAEARSRRPAAAIGQIARRCLPLALPMLLMLAWRSGVQAETSGFLNLQAKLGWIESALRSHWKTLDGWSLEGLVAVIGAGMLLLRVDLALGLAGVLLAIAYVALPETLMGSNYADMRLAPYLVAVALLALGPPRRPIRHLGGAIAALALAFVMIRVGAETASLRQHAEAYRPHLAAIDHIPRGARVYTLVAPPCDHGWDGPRLDHVGSLAIVRRDAFVNDQWADPGAQLLRVRLPIAPDYAASPSQLIRPPACDRPEPLLSDRLQGFPRAQFDMLWLIGVSARDRPHDRGLRPVWSNDADALYRIVSPSGDDRPLP